MNCIIKSSDVSLNSDGMLIITLPNIDKLSNCEIIKFVICQNIPTTNPLAKAYININGTNIGIFNGFGNNVLANQLKTRKCYTIGFQSTNPNFYMLTQLPCSNYPYPKYIFSTVAETEEMQTDENNIFNKDIIQKD